MILYPENQGNQLEIKKLLLTYRIVLAEQKVTVDITNPARIDLKGAEMHHDNNPKGKSAMKAIIQG